MFLAGEAPPQLTYQGARNRVLDLRVAEYPPLGLGRDDPPTLGQLPGHARAKLLKEAIDQGAGSLGHQLTQVSWDDWESFAARVREKEAKANRYNFSAQEWLRPLVAAAVALEHLFAVASLPTEYYPNELIPWVYNALRQARTENDPVRSAFTELLALVNNAQRFSDSNERLVRGERVAYLDTTTLDWLVIPSAKAVVETLQPFGGLQGLGAQWVRSGWVTPDGQGKATQRRRIHGNQQRVLAIKDKVMRDGVEDADATPVLAMT